MEEASNLMVKDTAEDLQKQRLRATRAWYFLSLFLLKVISLIIRNSIVISVEEEK
jgi:hypothetical protein